MLGDGGALGARFVLRTFFFIGAWGLLRKAFGVPKWHTVVEVFGISLDGQAVSIQTHKG